jgi:hypothetical protein
LWLVVVALFGALLGLSVAAPTGVHAQGTDLPSIVNAFISGENAHDVNGVTALFASNATVVLATGPLQGTDQIKAWQQELANGHFSIVVTSPVNVSGNKADYTVTVALDTFRQLGLQSLDGTEEMVVDNGKITSFTFAFTPDSAAKFQAALQSTGAGSPGMPTTGSPDSGEMPWTLLVSSLLLCVAGCALRRKAPHRG